MTTQVATPAKARRGGDKTSMHELEQRLDLVEGLMTSGMPTHKIVSTLFEQKKWPVSTVHRYVHNVRERWRVAREAERATEIEASIARLAMLSGKAERDKAWAAVRGFEQLLADIRGVRAAERVDHRVAVAVVPQAAPVPDASIDELPDDVLDALERAADAKIARGALPAHVPDASHG